MQFPSNEDNLLVEELHVKNHLKQWGGGETRFRAINLSEGVVVTFCPIV